jgi:hypothetical protein
MAVADRLPKPSAATRLTGLSARNFIRPTVFDGFAGLIHLRLLASGLAAPDIAWQGRPGLALPDEWETGMDAAIDAAISDAPDTAPLRALLATIDAVAAPTGAVAAPTAGTALRFGAEVGGALAPNLRN